MAHTANDAFCAQTDVEARALQARDDVALLADQQMEHNRSREGMREHRQAARPAPGPGPARRSTAWTRARRSASVMPASPDSLR